MALQGIVVLYQLTESNFETVKALEHCWCLLGDL